MVTPFLYGNWLRLQLEYGHTRALEYDTNLLFNMELIEDIESILEYTQRNTRVITTAISHANSLHTALHEHDLHAVSSLQGPGAPPGAMWSAGNIRVISLDFLIVFTFHVTAAVTSVLI